ncbi:MAG: glycosyltransferase [Betaproteobacteria bacterium]
MPRLPGRALRRRRPGRRGGADPPGPPRRLKTGTDHVFLSVVVPAYNEERLLPATLTNLRQVLPTPFELIVCDNNSTDRTPEIARAAGAQVVFEPVNQISRARNRGAAAATGDWLLFVDADSLPSKELILETAEAIRSGSLAGGATVAFETRELFVRFWLVLWNATSRLMQWAAGSYAFVEAAAFREVGGFSEELYAGEELDLFRRLKRLARRQGRRIAILHRHPLRTSDRKARLYAWHEHLWFLFKTLLTGGRTLRRREDCAVWYDGRR